MRGLKPALGTSALRLREESGENNESKFMRAMKERMAAEAASLRAEAGLLEAEQRKLEAEEIELMFQEFDLNNDGEISEDELRIGLRRLLKEDIPEGKIKQLMIEFDDSGDGALQLDEFRGLKAFKAKIDLIVAEEKEEAIREVYRAREEAQQAKAAEARAQAVANILNDRRPTFKDGLVSCLPYFFPLADSLSYGRYIFDSMPDSPLTQVAVLLSTIYSSIPFAGLIAFFALASISRNLRLNRLIRFSIQQAIFLDVALIIPGFIGSIFAFLLPEMPPEVVSQASSAFFIVFSSVLLYAITLTACGKFPNAIPLISARAEERLPTASQLEKYFDDEGNVIPLDRPLGRDDSDGSGDDKN